MAQKVWEKAKWTFHDFTTTYNIETWVVKLAHRLFNDDIPEKCKIHILLWISTSSIKTFITHATSKI